MSTALRCSSSARSTVTEVRARGWQSGMRSGVRLAAMMPASRATDSTSPFFTPPSRIIASVAGCMITEPLAVALRSVISLSETSTITALPSASKWVKPAIKKTPLGSACLALHQRAGRGGHVALAHERLADEEGARAGRRHAREIGWRVEAALGDQQAVARRARRELLGDREVDRQGLQIAVVDADQRRVQFQRAVELCAVVHL